MVTLTSLFLLFLAVTLLKRLILLFGVVTISSWEVMVISFLNILSLLANKIIPRIKISNIINTLSFLFFLTFFPFFDSQLVPVSFRVALAFFLTILFY